MLKTYTLSLVGARIRTFQLDTLFKSFNDEIPKSWVWRCFKHSNRRRTTFSLVISISLSRTILKLLLLRVHATVKVLLSFHIAFGFHADTYFISIKNRCLTNCKEEWAAKKKTTENMSFSFELHAARKIFSFKRNESIKKAYVTFIDTAWALCKSKCGARPLFATSPPLVSANSSPPNCYARITPEIPEITVNPTLLCYYRGKYQL